jgi:hypothetical protein
MSRPLRVLVVEDSRDDAQLLLRELERCGYEVESKRVETAEAMRAALERTTWDAVLSDYSLPEFSGTGALAVLQSSGLDIPFIIISGTMGEETAVASLKAGAHDFMVKGHLARLAPALDRAMREARERQERRRMEDALRQSEARFHSLIEHTVVGIYQATLEGRFLTVNLFLAQMLAYDSVDDLIHVDLAQIWDDTSVYADLLERARQAGHFTGEEVIWRRQTGESIRVRLSGRLVETGHVPAIEAIVEDVTERHRIEEQLRQALKLEGIGRLAGGIAHDFNNILTTIVGYSEMVLEQIGPDKPISADLVEIRNAGDRATRLTRQLLAFSRQQVLRIENVDVSAIVRDTEAMLHRLIGEDITIDLGVSDLPCRILADRSQLEQVLINIAVNARDAMPRGGRLAIEIDRATVAEIATLTGLPVVPGPYIKLAITDTGTGMDAATRDRIFEPFFTTKAIGLGTGLGLATVHGIVNQLHGYIWVTSDPGQGATFTLFFPQSERPVESPTVAPVTLSVSPLATEREVVLVVEDEAGVRSLVTRTLERHGYRVLQAGTPVEGLAVARSCPSHIDLIISDMVMPVMSGPEMVAELQCSNPTTKVLYMSGYAADMLSRGGGLADGAYLLEKPFASHALLSKVREVLDAP